MVKWIGRIGWDKVLLSAFLYTASATIIKQIESIIIAPYFQIPTYFGVWNKFVISLVITFATGVSLTVIYYYLKEYLPKGSWKRTTFFADLLVSTSFVFFTLPAFLLFNIPVALLGVWFASSFITLLVASIIIVKLIP